ncbi:hypothetical protein GOM49_00235 [Clostridium bovifaecis]|uniref:Uncharacterized protein n=1 Tax=Clostridium bovifaecis TaxID=2184719 RepID=A0A6I6F0A9_9CLOT|nr:hypothetical protein GOM49_00235 [Clostridium bovifaecis]
MKRILKLIDDMDFQVFIEADFLVNIFEDNVKKEELHTIRNKCFKTEIGTKYLENIYINV